jgi:flavodoxin I
MTMNKIALIYWPEGGNVETVADKFVGRFDGKEVVKVSLGKIDIKILQECSHWIVGGSTVGSHVWEDASDSNKWNDFFHLLDKIDMANKTVAFYGLGDQILYPNHFVDGLGLLQEEFEKRKTRIIGRWPVNGYEFNDSNGAEDGMFFGLALDQDHQEELTDARVEQWMKIIGPEFRK